MKAASAALLLVALAACHSGPDWVESASLSPTAIDAIGQAQSNGALVLVQVTLLSHENGDAVHLSSTDSLVVGDGTTHHALVPTGDDPGDDPHVLLFPSTGTTFSVALVRDLGHPLVTYTLPPPFVLYAPAQSPQGTALTLTFDADASNETTVTADGPCLKPTPWFGLERIVPGGANETTINPGDLSFVRGDAGSALTASCVVRFDASRIVDALEGQGTQRRLTGTQRRTVFVEITP